MAQVTIDRELLEELRDAANDCLNHAIMRGNDRNVPAYTELVEQADAALDAPRQPEGDGLEVVESLHVWRATNRFGDTCHFGDAGCARVWAGAGGKVDRIELKPVPELYDVNHSDAAEVSATEIKVVAWAHCADATRLLCDLGKQRSVPGHYADEFTTPLCRLSDAQRAIAELRGLVPELPPRPPEGDGMPRYGLRWNGPRQPVSVPMADGYWTPWHLAEAECERLRQQLAELRAQLLAIASAEPRRHTIEWAKAMAATGNNEAYAKWRTAFDQRDKLAGLLREKFPRIDPENPYPLDEVEHHCEYTLYQERERLHREIDAALAEVKPCQESPAPTTSMTETLP